MFHLRELPRLDILALEANPMMLQQHARTFVLHHLGSLAVLDGVSVSDSEVRCGLYQSPDWLCHVPLYPEQEPTLTFSWRGSVFVFFTRTRAR